MRWLRPLFIAVLPWTVATGAVAQGYPLLCDDDTIRGQCAGTCVVACDDPGFLSENAIYCINAGALSDTRTTFDDPPNCPVLVGLDTRAAPAISLAPALEETAGTTIRIEDCDQLQSAADRDRCVELAAGPACSDSVAALIDRSAILGLTIEGRMAVYGDVLAAGQASAGTANPLCAVTPAAFTGAYEAAAGKPELLRSIRRAAGEIAACAADWEDFVNRRADAAGAEAELAALRGELGELQAAVDALENAGAAVLTAATAYMAECDFGDAPTDVTSTSATTGAQ